MELEDEHYRLCDVALFQPILKVAERLGKKADKITNAQISALIGKGTEFIYIRIGVNIRNMYHMYWVYLKCKL